MAAVTAAVAVGVTGAALASKSARGAARKQSQSADKAADQQLDQFNQTREDFAPFRQAGVSALGRIMGLLNLDIPEGFGGEFSADVDAGRGQGESPTDILRATPGYQFQLDEGIKAIDRSSAAQGAGGAQIKALADYATGLADQSFGKYFNRLQSLAGLGQTSTAQVGGLGAQAVSNAGQFGVLSGQAQAANQINQANIGTNLIDQFSQLAAQRNFNRGSQGQQVGFGSQNPGQSVRGFA